jgi:hypothetical protein
MSVEALLDKLFDQLSGTGGAGRRALAEAEDHLRSAVADAQSRGLSRAEAEAEAVARFGPPEQIARELRVAHQRIGAILRPAFTGAWMIGAACLLAMGVSGLISEVLGRTVSPGFIAGDTAGVTYTAERCADYFEYAPTAASCGDAAAFHHWGEVVEGRVAAGVLGLLATIALLVARRTVLRGAQWTPPGGTVAVVLVALFLAVAGLLGLPSAVQAAFFDTTGAGAGLADGAVAAVAAIAWAAWGLRHRRVTAANA